MSELAGHYAMTRPAISQHLTVLERAGMVARDRRAQWRDCRLEPHGLDAASAWIDQQRADWTERLDALDEHLRRGRTGGPSDEAAPQHPEKRRQEEEEGEGP